MRTLEHAAEFHARLRANVTRWKALTFVGYQPLLNTDKLQLEFRHCTCGSTLSRRVERITMTFEIYEDRGGEYRWRLRSANGQIVADSGEGYTRRDDAREAAIRVRDEVATAKIIEA